jgi:hypothetical protein
VKLQPVILLFVLGFILTVSVPGQAGTADVLCFVAPDGDDGNDCSSIEDACQTINAALAESGCTGTIHVASGTYTGTDSEPVVSINKSIALSGGWDETFNEQNGTSTIDGEDARRGLEVSSDLSAFIEQFTITRGQGDGSAGVSNYGTLTLFKSTVKDNIDIGDWTSEGGGIRNGGSGTLYLFNSTVSDNQSSSGAGIFNEHGIVVITNSTISGNLASGTGSGINNLGGTIYINNATIANNSDNVEEGGEPVAGGIHNEDGGIVYLKNSIVAHNNDGGPDCNGPITSSGYNLFGNVSGCIFSPTDGDMTNVDPKIGPLQDNGGATFTHALEIGSSAINRGTPPACEDHQGAPLDSDQRFYARVQRCDIGAFEFQTFLYYLYLPSLAKQ